MTPKTLHKRILLHELRTILLDDTREGEAVPQEWAQAIRENPHDESVYLIMADALEQEQASVIGELCRIQCALIEELPVIRNPKYFAQFNRYGELHGFAADLQKVEKFHQAKDDLDSLELAQRVALLARRWEIVEPLYAPKECFIDLRKSWLADGGDFVRRTLRENGMDHELTKARRDEENIRWACTQPRKLGRTTRMLTDVLRYCVLNEGKRVLVRHDDPQESQMRFDALCTHFELWGNGSWTERGAAHFPNGNTVHFGGPETTHLVRTNESIVPRDGYEYDIERQRYINVETVPPGITFTDHACRLEPEHDPLWLERSVLATRLGRNVSGRRIEGDDT